MKFPKIEIFAKFCSKLVRFYIKILQIVQFLLILCILSNYTHKCPIKTVSTESIMSIYIHKFLKLPRFDPNLLSLKMLAMSLFILTLFLDMSSHFINNTKYFRHISYQWLKTNQYKHSYLIEIIIILYYYQRTLYKIIWRTYGINIFVD